MNEAVPTNAETDPRFPSGPWIGFWLQKLLPPGKHQTELHLTFHAGQMKGEGRDCIGKFIIQGTYTLADGRCQWIKRYLGRHAVSYRGFNEGKGIWGVWEISSDRLQGGFHIWPKGMPDPSQPQLTEQADLPTAITESLEVTDPLAVPVGCGDPGEARQR